MWLPFRQRREVTTGFANRQMEAIPIPLRSIGKPHLHVKTICYLKQLDKASNLSQITITNLNISFIS
jgi:hypothetical protein